MIQTTYILIHLEVARKYKRERESAIILKLRKKYLINMANLNKINHFFYSK